MGRNGNPLMGRDGNTSLTSIPLLPILKTPMVYHPRVTTSWKLTRTKAGLFSYSIIGCSKNIDESVALALPLCMTLSKLLKKLQIPVSSKWRWACEAWIRIFHYVKNRGENEQRGTKKWYIWGCHSSINIQHYLSEEETSSASIGLPAMFHRTFYTIPN